MLALFLIFLSMGSYLTQIMVFHKTEDTFFYMLQDFAFLPVQVLLATMILNSIMSRREKLAMMKKINMVVGIFFTEVGRDLLGSFSGFDSDKEELGRHLRISQGWTAREFSSLRDLLKRRSYRVDCRYGDLEGLKAFLVEKREFMLTLMENPNLLEHQSFTDMLLAIFHLVEELSARDTLGDLPETDRDHLSGDIERAYMRLLGEWVGYMKHLKEEYPFLFSFMVRTNPFDPAASVEITE
ncbi:MAG: hypothetical protein HGA78_09815 [Nitrospirales bacterium]|nr:hypothetical protein [Nitrospirales bacterium]